MLKYLPTLILLLTPVFANAAAVDMRDFIQVKRGMSEAEVLYRLGPYDHASVYSDIYHQITRKTWYYIPGRRKSEGWITEITFDYQGNVSALNRYRTRK